MNERTGRLHILPIMFIREQLDLRSLYSYKDCKSVRYTFRLNERINILALELQRLYPTSRSDAALLPLVSKFSIDVP
jgi:hypothetical protein